MLAKAHDTRKIKTIVPRGLTTGRSVRSTPKIRTRIPFTTPRTVPPIMYANEISNPDSGAVNRSGNCWSNFICSIDDDVLAVALVSVFIMMRPGKINKVYGTP